MIYKQRKKNQKRKDVNIVDNSSSYFPILTCFHHINHIYFILIKNKLWSKERGVLNTFKYRPAGDNEEIAPVSFTESA
jgi:hypothetical protein